ncbi:cytochrome c biogenesis protein ResB [Dysgonomonas sp. Marseille-P4677]|nr:cytochrome c biogenesis protein ResB [Dysgonomonas sp. Marseille-P4677]
MWQFPWQYKESIAFVGGITIIGIILQLIIGKFDFYLLSAPVNIIIGTGIILLLLLLSLKRKSVFYQWLSGIPFSVTLIVALLIMSMIMGLIPQVVRLDPHDNSFSSIFGIKQITTFWPFILVYIATLLSLGALIIRRLIAFKKQDYAFYLNHIGLWILLFAAGLGSADIKRFVMHVNEGEVEWRVYSDSQDIIDLPIAIQLNDFYMEEYSPKLTIIDRNTGESQPTKKAEYFSIDNKRPKGQIADWDITLKEYIHEAIRNSDSTYHEVHMPGSSPAALVTAVNKNTGVECKGWVCGGNVAQLYMTLNLDSTYCIVMTQPEPKRFVSYIDVFTEDGAEYRDVELEVNKPLKVGNWMIYQYGYDNMAGKMSTYSSMELVYDPWIYPAYLGITLLALGSICLLWRGNKKKESTNSNIA